MPSLTSTRMRASLDGSLSGSTVAVKDMFATADAAPTSCASRMLQDYRSPLEATAVKRLREAGALLIGKTNMDEFGMGALASDTGGSTRLPASYCGVYGLKPSYGLISRYGLVAYASSLDTVGVMSRDVGKLAGAFDVLSAYDPKDPTSTPDFARERAQVVHNSTLERLDQSGQQTAKPLDGVRIGVPADLFPASLLSSATLLDPMRSFLRILISLGASLTSVRLPSAPLGLSAYYVLASAEASSNLARYDGVQYGYRAAERNDGEKELLYARTRSEGFGKEVKKRVLLGTFALSAEAFDNYYLQAQRVRRLIQLELDDLFRSANPLAPHKAQSASTEHNDGVDFLLHPSAMSTAPLLSSYLCPSSESRAAETAPAPSTTSATDTPSSSSRSAYVQDLLSLPASLAGLPALSIPAGRADGWPVGVTLVGQWGADSAVLHVARTLERVREKRGV
ncbi:hypothetical protein Rhopal_005001-T1 [Rhodotorula paludigena]|uniref:Glutamyl-tRNA(Gln) amidotransferase subunit A, mitochondrial n=1 Tax=Rhodotorula paludigena TaxID=86838 RepID=A0AAV5GTM7_9BASI|nr:hypothetical protein Rhopal_005001-T1 [Rhodotorula paludigena]